MADSKVTQLTENTTPALTDLLYLIDDPGGSPAGQKITLANIATLILGSAGLIRIDEATPSGTGVVTFSSLGSYRHLEIRYHGRGTQAATSTNINLTFNGDTGANYDRELLSASATTPVAAESLAQTSAAIGSLAAASAPAGLAGSGVIRINDYRGTTFQKCAISNDSLQASTSSGGTFSRQFGIWWRSTNAITSITLTLASGNYDTGTKFTLYGLN